MSVHPYTYLGPFAEVQVRRVQSKRDSCTQPSVCPKPETGFCAQCGKPAAQRLITITTYDPDLRGYLDEHLLDVLVVQGVPENRKDHTLFRVVPNEKREATRKFGSDLVDGGGDAITEITPTLISDEMRWFRRAFKQELEQLQALQFHSFEIRWGQIIYWY